MKSPLSDEEAHIIALKALAFLAGESTRLERFLRLTGIDPSEVREAAESPDFLIGLLDHLLADESLLLAFVAEHDLDPRLPALAAQSLDRQRVR